jgi:ABC-type sugar transport system ATPase subunit
MVVMGESTAALGVRGTAQVLDLVHHSRGEGVTVLLMSYAMEDVAASTDRATILRLGRRLAAAGTRGQTAGSLADLVHRMANARPPACRPS